MRPNKTNLIYIYKQTLTYCKLLNKKLGILVNFNVDDILSDAIIRVVNRL